MSVKINVFKNLIFSAPINDSTSKWGVYAIPRLWKEPNGDLIIRFNGEQDTAFSDKINQAPNLYFRSSDNGDTFEFIPDGEEKYDIGVLLGIGSPYLKLRSGEIIALRGKKNLCPLSDIKPEKRFRMPNGEAIVHTYKYGDIDDNAKGLERIYLKDENSDPIISDSEILFDDREVFVNAEASYEGADFVPVKQFIQPFIFKNPYIAGLTELRDGTLLALTFGQNPKVSNRYCPSVYLLESVDKGLNWRLRSTVAEDFGETPYGYSGDGNEADLALCENGDLLCSMRMDMSVDPKESTPLCDTMLAISHDSGFNWEKPISVADSSVTPHIITLENGIAVLIYGRPGVHFKISEDNGANWSKPYNILGKTLEEERESGKSDSDSKYFDTSSYSNTFAEKISKNTFIVVYNDMKFDEGDGEFHKAGFIQRITVEKVD